jgi:hypothetical protein
MPSEFKMSGTVTLDFYTRALSDSSYAGKLCVYLFDRHETGSPPKAEDSMLADKGSGLSYWTYTPTGNGLWPNGKWEEVRLTMSFSGPKKIPAADRVGVALSAERTGTASDAFGILYDHPNYRTRIEIETTTPLNGG